MGNQPALCGTCPCAEKAAGAAVETGKVGANPAVSVGARSTLVDTHDQVVENPAGPDETECTADFADRDGVTTNRSWEEGGDNNDGPMAPPPAPASPGKDDAAATVAPTEPPSTQKASPLPLQSPGRGDGDGGGMSGKTALEWASEQEQFAHLPALPQGWIRVKSASTGRLYYFNMVTGKTTFTEPTDLPPGWVQIKSRSTGQPYYWNAQLKKSQFERPTGEAVA